MICDERTSCLKVYQSMPSPKLLWQLLSTHCGEFNVLHWLDSFLSAFCSVPICALIIHSFSYFHDCVSFMLLRDEASVVSTRKMWCKSMFINVMHCTYISLLAALMCVPKHIENHVTVSLHTSACNAHRNHVFYWRRLVMKNQSGFFILILLEQ